MSLVAVCLILLVSAGCRAAENETVDKALAELVAKAGVTESPSRAFGFKRNIGPLEMEFSLVFSGGKLRLTGAERAGDASTTEAGGLGFRAELAATADYSYRLASVGEARALSAGRARVDWQAALQAELAVDGCSVTLGKFAVTTKAFDVDVWPNDDKRSATVHPPSDNEFQVALKPTLQQYLKSSFDNVKIC